MHHEQNRGKRSFAGSLTRRIILIATVILVIPLIIHSLFLYREEFLIEERDARAYLKGLGSQLVLRISSQIEMDWKILSLNPLPQNLGIQSIVAPNGIKGNFAFLNLKGNQLVVGTINQTKATFAISHPVDQLLNMPSEPFPIHSSLTSTIPPSDAIHEQFPIPNTNLVLTLSTSWDLITDLQTSRWIFRISTFLGLVFLIGGGLLFLLVRKFSRSLDTLKGTMQRVAEGAVHSRFSPQKLGFEINAIGLELNDTLDALVQQQEIARKEAAEKERLAEELALGRQIQNDLLPRHLPSVHGLKVSVGYLAAKEVSGDFYDLYPCKAALQSKNSVLIVVADLAGKGIGACLHSIGLRSSLRAFASSGASLKEIVQKAEMQFLCDAADSGLFATLWIGLLNDTHLSYLCLGHPPAFLKRNEEIIELTTNDPSLGILDNARLQERSIQLQSEDELLLYTDGAIEAQDPDGNLFGIQKLKNVFLATSSSQEILEEIEKFSLDALQHDDLTLLHIQFL